VLAALTPAGEDSEAALRALFRVKSFAKAAGIDLQSISEEEPDIATRLMITSLASLLEDPILYEALRGFERPSDLRGVQNIAVALYSRGQSRKRATPSVESSRDRGGDAAADRRVAFASLDSDDEEAEEPGGGTRGKRLPPLKDSQLRRSISREAALAVRADEVTEAARRAEEAAGSFSVAIAPPSHRDDVRRALLSNGQIDAEGASRESVELPLYITTARRAFRVEVEGAIARQFPPGADFTASDAELAKLLEDARNGTFDLPRLRGLAKRSLGASGVKCDEQRELEQALRILRVIASPAAKLMHGDAAGEADAGALADWCGRVLSSGDLATGAIATIVARVFGDYDQAIGAFIRGTRRRPPSFTGTLDACSRIVEQAKFDHRFSKLGHSPARSDTPSKGKSGGKGKGRGDPDGKPKGRAGQSSGGQQATHPAILRISGDSAQKDAFFSLLRSDYNKICHQQIYRGCDTANCSREHIKRGSKEAKAIVTAASAVCPATAL